MELEIIQADIPASPSETRSFDDSNSLEMEDQFGVDDEGVWEPVDLNTVILNSVIKNKMIWEVLSGFIVGGSVTYHLNSNPKSLLINVAFSAVIGAVGARYLGKALRGSLDG
jgi:hypothetical protein